MSSFCVRAEPARVVDVDDDDEKGAVSDDEEAGEIPGALGKAPAEQESVVNVLPPPPGFAATRHG